MRAEPATPAGPIRKVPIMADTKTAPKPAAPADAPKAPKAPALTLADLGAMQSIDTLPIATRQASETLEALTKVVKGSFDANRPVAFTVATPLAKALVQQIHSAAARAGLGVKVRPENLGNGQTRVAFQGKTKTVRVRKPKA
jgi:hypothetical protein